MSTHIGNGTERKKSNDRPKRATGLVDVGEEFRRITSLGESGEGARATVNTAQAD